MEDHPLGFAYGLRNAIIITTIIFWLPACIVAAIAWSLL